MDSDKLRNFFFFFLQKGRVVYSLTVIVFLEVM